MTIHAQRIGLALTLASPWLAAAGCGSSSEDELTLSAEETQSAADTARPFTCRDGQRISVWTRNTGAATTVTVTWADLGPCAPDAAAPPDGGSILDAEAPDASAGASDTAAP